MVEQNEIVINLISPFISLIFLTREKWDASKMLSLHFANLTEDDFI